MASPACWKCLSRPSVVSVLPIRAIGASVASSSGQSASFSTTTPVAGSVVKATRTATTPQKGKKNLGIRKKKALPTSKGRRIDFGERKAFRKRIVLTNSNALAVDDMSDLTAKMALDPEAVGKVAGLDTDVIAKLRTEEAFKPTQAWGLFHRAGMLVRKETHEVAKNMEEAQEKKSTYSVILDGPKKSGKSALLLQSMSIAHLNNWIVLYMPEAQELVDATTDYTPMSDTNPQEYFQNVYATRWLRRISKANSNILSKLKVQLQHKTPVPVNPSATLERLAEIGAREFEYAPAMFNAFIREITAPGRPPIFLGVDGLSHILGMSQYRNSDFEPIHSHDLSLVKQFFEYFSGAKELPNGGCVMAATTKGNTVASAELDLALKNHAEAAARLPLTKYNPYKKFDERVFNAIKKAEVINLVGMSKAEARGLMEYWAASGLLRKRVDEQSVTEAWAVSGQGVVGEMERGSLFNRV